MVQVSLSTTTTFDGDLNALVEDLGTALTVRFDLDEPAHEGGLRVYVDSEVEQIINRLNLPGFAANPTLENVDFASFVTNFDNSGFALTINEGATFGSFTIDVFDNPEPDTFLPETFDGRVEAALSLRTQDEVDVADQDDITGVGDYTIDPSAASSTVIFADDASQLMDTPDPPEPEPPTPEPPVSDGLQVSLFTGPDYLIEDEGTVSAHAFLATGGVIPEGGLIVSVDALNLSEFDLSGISVEGGEIAAVRDGGFDLRMTEYTTLVNLPVADDGETEVGETATFSLATGDGYEIISDYSSGMFNLVDTQDDIPRGVVTEPNDIISAVVTDTKITPENPSFSVAESLYFDIGNRYLNEDGNYEYIDYYEDVDLYQVGLSAGETIAVEASTLIDEDGVFEPALNIFNADGNQLSFDSYLETAAPDRLFTVDETGNAYLEFTASEDGIYYIGFASYINSLPSSFSGIEGTFYSVVTPNTGEGNRSTGFGTYELDIDLLTEDNPRQTGTPTPPVSNPGVTNPPTLSLLSATPSTVDSNGDFINAVVEFVEEGGISSVNLTVQAEGEIPEEGIEFVLNSNVNLFDYTGAVAQLALPSTIGGQSLGAFYNEDGIPTGIRLLIEEPTMTVNLERANRPLGTEEEGLSPTFDEVEGLETDGVEEVSFFLQTGEGYVIAPDAGETVVTYYDSVEDVPTSTGSGNAMPEVGVTISESALIESEGTETTLTFSLSEPPPAEGLVVYLDSEQDPVVGSVLGQFNVLEAEIEGGDFPISNSDSSGFFFNITEQTATITLSVFDELTVINDPLTFQEGILGLNFALQPQASYNINPDASEINLTIADNPESKIQVSLTASTEADPESTALIESEGTVSVHTFSLSAPPPVEGLTVSVSADSLSDFDLDAIEVQGGTITNLSDDGFDLTITEREAVISLPILQDDTNEGSETATFTLEPGDSYEINQAAIEAIFALADTPDQVSVPEEIETNNSLSEANALGLSAANPVVSISGSLFAYGSRFPVDRVGGYSEDVDFYAVTLEAGQTLALDIDSDVAPLLNPGTVLEAQQDVLQTTDTELRLFDAEGNELAANNDGAAPGEEFSRDPFIEYTAESAGTYYVGVSQLGNRNYDPNVEGSGSGWTFPEVGVFFGEYELTASLAEGNGGGGGLTGTNDDDLLTGTDGDDLLDGLLGDDIYTGGAGADQFVLGIAQGVDTITDFEIGVDQIKLGGLTPEGVKFFELSSDTLVLTNSNELIGVVQGVTGLDSSVFA